MGTPKNILGTCKRKHVPKWSSGVFFFTHSHLGIEEGPSFHNKKALRQQIQAPTTHLLIRGTKNCYPDPQKALSFIHNSCGEWWIDLWALQQELEGQGDGFSDFSEGCVPIRSWFILSINHPIVRLFLLESSESNTM